MSQFDPGPFFQPNANIDMSRPPTEQEALAISLYHGEEGAYYQHTPTPLTEQEALWLQTYMGYALKSLLQIQMIETILGADPARHYAIELSYGEPGWGGLLVVVHNLQDWKRLQRWSARPGVFERESVPFSDEQAEREEERCQTFRAMVYVATKALDCFR